jgi:SHS2 domain-containing protein
MKKYSFIEHTADIGIRAYGKSLEECFENAALAMFNIISDTKKISSIGEYELRIKAESIEQLLIDWLSRLLWLYDTNNFLFSKFEVELDEKNYSLSARIGGEVFNSKKHPRGKDIKAVTYHMLVVNKKEGYVQVLFDI